MLSCFNMVNIFLYNSMDIKWRIANKISQLNKQFHGIYLFIFKNSWIMCLLSYAWVFKNIYNKISIIIIIIWMEEFERECKSISICCFACWILTMLKLGAKHTVHVEDKIPTIWTIITAPHPPPPSVKVAPLISKKKEVIMGGNRKKMTRQIFIPLFICLWLQAKRKSLSLIGTYCFRGDCIL